MSVDALKQAMLGKVADAPSTNEDETNLGTNNIRKTPAGRAPDTLDARWGDTPSEGRNGYPDVYGSAVFRESHDGRGDLLDRIFDSLASSSAAEQGLMRQHFAHADEGEPHSPILQHGRLSKVAEADETLTDQVMRIVGWR